MVNDPRYRALADSYLDHTLLALRVDDRGANFRDFLDPWWVYERGGNFVKVRREGGFSAHDFNNPCPWMHRNRLPSFDYCSRGARTIIAKGEAARKVSGKAHSPDNQLIIDHAVPFAVLKPELWRSRADWDRNSLRAFLQRNFKRSVLSIEENERLKGAGLNSKMPDGWVFGDDPYARYWVCGLEARPKLDL